jgi:hypothetical protein
MARNLFLIVAVLFLISCNDNPDPEFKTEGCGEEQTIQIENAISEVVTTGLEHIRNSSSHTRAQKRIFKKICELSVSITIICKECNDEDPNPCSFSQPDLPLLQDEDRITVNEFLNELQKEGGITITICSNADGSIPSDSCTTAIHSSRDLRDIILHELNHYVINDYTHSSSTWTDVEEVSWDEDE